MLLGALVDLGVPIDDAAAGRRRGAARRGVPRGESSAAGRAARHPGLGRGRGRRGLADMGRRPGAGGTGQRSIRGSASSRWRRSSGSPRPRHARTGYVRTRSTSTRSARTTRSRTSSGRAPESSRWAPPESSSPPSRSDRIGADGARSPARPGARGARADPRLAGRRLGTGRRGARDARPASRWPPRWRRSPGALPSMTISEVGVGAGTRDVPHRPNVVRLVMGEVAGEVVGGRPRRPPTPSPWRRTSTTSTPGLARRSRPPAGRRCARRLADPDPHEEGPARHTLHVLARPADEGPDRARPGAHEHARRSAGTGDPVRAGPGVGARRGARRQGADQGRVAGRPRRARHAEYEDAAELARATGMPVTQVLSAAAAAAVTRASSPARRGRMTYAPCGTALRATALPRRACVRGATQGAGSAAALRHRDLRGQMPAP
jgi:hypothetical protein